MTRTRLIETGHGSITQLRFVDDRDDFITSGNDGRLIRWTASGEHELLFHFGQRIDDFARASATDSIVFSTGDGALWRLGTDRLPRSLRSAASRVSRIYSFPDQRTLYVGHASGEVLAIDTSSWQHRTVLQASGAVREIAVAGDGRTVAVATNDGIIHIGHIGRIGTRAADVLDPVRWVPLHARASHISMTHDGLLVATCTDGALWLYFAPQQRGLYVPTGTVDLGRTAVTATGDDAVALSFEGRMLWIDLRAARTLLGVTRQSTSTRNQDIAP